jgi:type IV pilus assembly protein PilP
MIKILVLMTLIFSVGAYAAPKNLQNFFKNKTKIDNPFNLRDPFKAPINKAEGKKKGRGFTITGKGSYSNIGDTDFASLSINTIRVVGVLIGKERRALVNGGGENKKIIILKEGLKIGPEQAEVKAILPGGIVLVEKIVNVYGEEEYLETVIPISR